MVHRLRLHALNAGGLGSIPGQGTRSHMLQLKIPCDIMKIKDPVCAATKTWRSQINKYILKNYFKKFTI